MLIISIAFIALFAASTSIANDLSDYKRSGHRSPAWSPLVEAGFDAYEGGDLDMAVNFFQRAMEKGCKDGLVYFKIALYYESKDALTNAREYLKLAEKYLPKQYPQYEGTKTIHEHIGRILFSLEDLAGAKTELNQAVRSQGPNFTLLFLLGSIARQENDNEKIIDYYKKALGFPPPAGTNPQDILITLLIEIGKAYYDLKQYDLSLEIWNQILAYVPNHPIARQFKDAAQRKLMNKSLKNEEQRILDQILQ